MIRTLDFTRNPLRCRYPLRATVWLVTNCDECVLLRWSVQVEAREKEQSVEKEEIQNPSPSCQTEHGSVYRAIRVLLAHLRDDKYPYPSQRGGTWPRDCCHTSARSPSYIRIRRQWVQFAHMMSERAPQSVPAVPELELPARSHRPEASPEARRQAFHARRHLVRFVAATPGEEGAGTSATCSTDRCCSRS